MSAPWQRVAGARPADQSAPATAPEPADRPSAPDVPEPADRPTAADVRGPGDGAGAGRVAQEVRGLAMVVADLDELADLPVGEHVPRYDALHGRLSDALSSIDSV